MLYYCLKIILEFGHYLPILLWNPVFKMIFTLLNRCKLQPTIRGLFNILRVNFFHFYTDFTALLRARYIEPVVKQK